MKAERILFYRLRHFWSLMPLFIFLMIAHLSSPQTAVIPLKVTVIVKPPVSSVFSEYGDLSNKVIITVMNPKPTVTYNRVMLHGSLKRTSDKYKTTLHTYPPPQKLTKTTIETTVFTADPVQIRS